jgi:integrase
MTLRIEQGKGRKDRYAMLCPALLEHLRAWWRFAHAKVSAKQTTGLFSRA